MRRETALELVEVTHAFFAQWKASLRSALPAGETNPRRVLVLVSLARMGPVSMGTLSARLAIAKPNLTALVDELEGEALVSRRADARDRRTLMLTLTPTGRRYAAKWKDRYDREVAKLFDVLPPPQRAALLATLTTLTQTRVPMTRSHTEK